jgi:hypothetical protein
MFGLEGRRAAEGSAQGTVQCLTGVSKTARCGVQTSSDQRFTKVLATEGVKLVPRSGVKRRHQQPVNQRAERLSWVGGNGGQGGDGGQKRDGKQSTCGEELLGTAENGA